VKKHRAQSIDLSNVSPRHADIQGAIKITRGSHELAFLHSAIDNDLPLRREDRKLLANFIVRETRLKARGRPPYDRALYPSSAKKLKYAVQQVGEIKKYLRSIGKNYRSHEPVIAEVAKRHNIEPDRLNNAVRRSKNPRT
jgi:hypothetical protein